MALTSTESHVIELLSKWIEDGRPEVEGLGSTGAAVLSCPAASEAHGDAVFAVFDEIHGELTFLPEVIEMPNIAKENLDLSLFAMKNRLVGKCHTTGCHHWQGACRLGYFVNSVSVTVIKKSRHCAIAQSCRWFKENGGTVCGPCASLRNVALEA